MLLLRRCSERLQYPYAPTFSSFKHFLYLHTDTRHKNYSMTGTPAATKVPARFATTQSKAFLTDLLRAFSNHVRVQPTLTLTTTLRIATASATLVSSIVVWVPNVRLRRASTANGSCLTSPRGTCGAVDWLKQPRLQKNKRLQLTYGGIVHFSGSSCILAANILWLVFAVR